MALGKISVSELDGVSHPSAGPSVGFEVRLRDCIAPEVAKCALHESIKTTALRPLFSSFVLFVK